MLPERLAALAVERQARRIHEDGREIGEQVTPAIEQLLLDDVLDAARRQSPLRLLFHLFTEPRYGPIEMMEVEIIDAGNVVVLHPGRAVTIRSGDEQSVQSADENSALDRELERAVLQQFTEHVGDAEPFPDPAKQQRSADPFGGNGQRSVGVLVERVDEQHLVGELGAGGEQRGESAGRNEVVGAPQIGDDGLAHGAVDALVLDHLDVGATVGLFDAEEHSALPKHSITESDSGSTIKLIIYANVAPRFEKIALRINEIKHLRGRSPFYCSSRVKVRRAMSNS